MMNPVCPSRASTLLVGATLSLLSFDLHAAKWSDELTSQIWATTDLDKNGANDCSYGTVNLQVATPGRPKGGWFEYRFHTGVGDKTFFQSIGTNDFTRYCPRTFNEYTTNHNHGVMNAKLAAYKGTVYSVYDTNSNYYYVGSIKLQQDPSSIGANNARSYAVAEIRRNNRRYAVTNPGSADYVGKFDVANDGVYDPDVDGCERLTSKYLTPPNNNKIDPKWREHQNGADHESTFCAPPAHLQTFDPDIDIEGDNAVVAWVERYVELKAWEQFPAPAGFRFGLDPDFAVQSPKPSWFPYRKFELHVNQYDADDLAGGYDNQPVGRIPTTPLSTVALNFGSSESTNAFSPRIAQQPGPSGNTIYVAWAEADFSFIGPTVDYVTGNGGPFGDRDMYSLPETNAGMISVYIKKRAPGDTAFGGALSFTYVGAACNPTLVSSGHATGRTRLPTATHDVAILNGQPVVVMNEVAPGGGCRVVVKRYNGSSWQVIGADLRIDTNYGVPHSPRITVVDNVPYVTWVEYNPLVWDNVYVKRLSVGTTWDQIGGAWNDTSSTDTLHRVTGPSIAVVRDSLTPASIQTGTAPNVRNTSSATVFVSMSEHEPGPLRVLDLKPGPWAATVRSCRMIWDSGASKFDCAMPPALYVDKERTPVAGENAIYTQPGHLGFTWGSPVVSGGQLSSIEADRWWNETGYNGANANKLGGGTLSSNPIYMQARSGLTDLLVSGVTQDGQPNALYLSYTGPVQDHRARDQGLYVRRAQANVAEQSAYASGADHTLMIGDEVPTGLGGMKQQLKVWGTNGSGQFGNGTTSTVPTSTKVTVEIWGETVVKVVAGTAFSAALTKSGKIFAWGANGMGQLCDGTMVNRTTPQNVSAGFTWSDIAAGDGHIIALRSNGEVKSCGWGAYGQLGDGRSGVLASPAITSTSWTTVTLSTAAPLIGARAVFSGGQHACAILNTGKAWCWGSNANGQLGIAATAGSYARAYAVNYGGRVETMALGYAHSSMLAASGHLLAWGSNSSGQLGLGDSTDRSSPTTVLSPPGFAVRSIASARNTLFYINATGTAYSTGNDTFGCVGSGATAVNRSTFGQVDGLAQAVFSGPMSDSVYKTEVGPALHGVFSTLVSCWGRGSTKQCHNGSTANQFVPVSVTP